MKQIIQNNRIKKIILTTMLVLGIGCLYGLMSVFLDIGIPCVFRLITHWNCPGCGISRFIIASAQFQFREAIQYNYFAPVICFLLVDLYLDNCYHYYKNGKTGTCKANNILCVVLIIVAVVWTIVRNIYGI